MCAETMIGFRDAYGHALWDYLRGRGRGYEVIERDEGYVDISGVASFHRAVRSTLP